jgi:DNA-binding NtrC family response regulator
MDVDRRADHFTASSSVGAECSPGSATVNTAAGASKRLSILVVDDDRALLDACTGFLRVHDHDVSSTGSGAEAIELVKQRRFDLALIDLHMTQVSGMELLRAIRAANRHTLVVTMTGNPSVETNLEALRFGAWDYLLKPFSPAHLEILLGRAVHRIASLTTPKAIDSYDLPTSSNGEPVTCVGVAPSFRAAVNLARRVAPTDASVMIAGESGTGKEVIARLIHRLSRRADRQMLSVNCAAMPEQLIETELFGYQRGAFPGAERDKPGFLESLSGATLFLNAITAMSLRVQAKLLRVVQDRAVRRLGAQTSTAVDVRFISATDRDPHAAVADGTLREDLSYRLRVVLIKLPPLRERREDIPLLANHFLSLYWSRHRKEPGIPTFAHATMARLADREWRGNVRELQNVVEHIAVLAEPEVPIGPEAIPEMVYEQTNEVSGTEPVFDDEYHLAREKVMKSFEKEYITRLLGRAGGNLSRAARIAQIDRTTLYRLLDRSRGRNGSRGG